MKRALLVVIGTAALAAAAGCGGSRRVAVDLPQARLVPPSPTALRFSTSSNRRFAHDDVQKLLGILVLPHNARLTARVPKSAPPGSGNQLTGRFQPGIAVAHRIWIVHEPLERVVRFVQAHAQPRPRPEVRFRGKNNGIRLRRAGWYSFPPVPGRSWERWLSVDMVELRGGGTTVIAQAGDSWVRPSPRSALLPAAVKRIDVVSRLGTGRPNVLVHVRQRYDVGWIVALVNGLGRADSERVACLAVLYGGPRITLRFRAASGKVLARSSVLDPLGSGRSSPCNPVQTTVGDRKAPPLIGADLLLRIQRLLGVDLAPPVPRGVSSCLARGDGWKVQSAQGSRRELTATKNGERWTITFHDTGKVTLDKPGPRRLERCLHRPRYLIHG